MNLQPIIKWSGSKRSQAKEITSYITKNYDTYYEPFCGGCSVLFYILNNCPNKFKHFICSDINKELIDTFNMIKNMPSTILETYEYFWQELNKDNNLERKKEYFNFIRHQFNLERNPCLFFFLMRTTTNGMPRYNSKGEFNNSFHITRNGIEPKRLKPILTHWFEILNEYNVEFIHQPFIDINTNENDFIYLDPPYYNTKGMYYGTIDYSQLWNFLENQKCDYMLSFDGIAGNENNIVNIPKNLYNNHILLNSGNSSFRRVIGKSKNTNVLESLYIKNKEE